MQFNASGRTFGELRVSQSTLLVRRQQRGATMSQNNQQANDNDNDWLTRPVAPYFGLYSGSGFDILQILSRIASRPNPTVQIGPIDMSSSFIISDARKEDFPIIYASHTFEQLTGYTSAEILGKNCRFLQAPDGCVEKGALRRYVDNNIVYQLKRSVDHRMECQYININYKKTGEPFVNLITIIPISFDATGDPDYFVGFQVDLMNQSEAILRTLEDRSYVIDFNSAPLPVDTPSCNTPRLVPISSPSSDGLNSLQPSPANAVACPPIYDDLTPFTEPQPKQEDLGLSTITEQDVLDEFLESDNPIVYSPINGQDDNDISSPIEAPQHSIYLDSSVSSPLLSNHDIPESTDFNYHELIQSSPDFIHILSSRGIILFVSPHSCLDLTEYEAGELIGRNIAQFCHPSDQISVMRELKGANVHDQISFMYRLQRKTSGYIWLEITGRKYEMSNRKRTKCFILSGRSRIIGEMKLTHLITPFPITTLDLTPNFLAKLSSTGFFLYIPSTSAKIFGADISLDSLYGQSLLDYIYEGDRPRVAAKLHQQSSKAAISGEECEVRCSIESGGRFLPAALFIYPENEVNGDARFLFLRVTMINRNLAGTGDNSVGCAAAAESVDNMTCVGRTTADVDIFAGMRADQDASLQYELNQLRMSNKRILEELEVLSAPPKKRRI